MSSAPALLVLIILFICVGCQQQMSTNDTSNDKDSIQASAPAPADSVQKEDFSQVTFLDGGGKPVTLESLKGKVIFINFWATWCPPCIQEMPSIDRLKQTFKNRSDLVFLMVDVDGQYEASKAFMDENDYDLPVYTPQSEIPTAFLGNAIPTTVILDKQGMLVVRAEGGRDYMEPATVKALNDLLGN